MTKLAQEYFKQKGWKYFLQGSRSKGLFGNEFVSADSDWDYYLDDNQHCHFPAYQDFEKDGWVKLDKLAYQDASTTRIYEKVFPDGKVQVSLRFEFDHMCCAWDSVPEEFYGKYLNKRSEKFLGKDFVKDFVNFLYWQRGFK